MTDPICACGDQIIPNAGAVCGNCIVSSYEDKGTAQQTINHLNDMLRDRGYSQGDIDAYVSQCELVQVLVDVIAGVEQHLPACAAYPNGDPTNCTCHIVALTLAREAGYFPTGQEPPIPF